MDGCFLGAPTRRHTIPPDYAPPRPAPPRRAPLSPAPLQPACPAAVRRLVPPPTWYVRVLDSTNLVWCSGNKMFEVLPWAHCSASLVSRFAPPYPAA